MKTAMSDYALTPQEITAMRRLAHGGSSIGELATTMDLSAGSTSKVVGSLLRKGLVSKRKEGLRSIVEPSENTHAQDLSELVLAYAAVPWENVLSYSNLPVLSRNLEDIEFPISLSQSTEWRVERNLGLYGLPPVKRNSALRLKLEQFITSYVQFARRQLADKLLPKDHVILWAKGFSFIAKTRKGEVSESPSMKKTSFSAFPSYGMRFITDSEYFFHNPIQKTLTLEDIVIHTILMDPSSRTNIGYATLLLLKEESNVNLDALLQKGRLLDIEATVKDVISLVKTHRTLEERSMPSWGDIQELAQLYEVKLKNGNKTI